MRPPAGETGLILVLAGGLVLHHWQRLLGGLAALLPAFPASLQSGPLLPRLAIACLALALPSAAFLLLRPLLGARARPLLYSLLPLLWALMLAHTLPLGMGEGGRVLPVSFAPLGAQAAALPAWSADPHVVAFCQSLATAVGVAGSLVLLRRLLQPSFGRWLLLGGLTLGLGVAGRLLVAA
jgi:hypothetical protein